MGYPAGQRRSQLSADPLGGEAEESVGYFDAIAEASFKTDTAGRHLFFPWGSFGRGYVIPTEEAFENTRRALSRMQRVVFTAVVVSVLARPWAPVAVLALYGVFLAYWARRTSAGWERSAERLSLLEAYDNQARSMNRRVIWALLMLSLVFMALGILSVVVEPRLRLITAPGVVLFALGGVVFIRMLRVSRGRTAK